MVKEDRIQFEGVTVEKLPDARFRVRLDNGRILGCLSGRTKNQDTDARGRSHNGRDDVIRPNESSYRLQQKRESRRRNTFCSGPSLR